MPDVRVQADGKEIRTVEGLADGRRLHPLQRAFIAHHGLQCGFCTPGFLMLAVNTLEQRPDIGDDELIDVLSSNLCRCTGYQNIIKAVKAARDEMRAGSDCSLPVHRRVSRRNVKLRKLAAVTSSAARRLCRSSEPKIAA